MKTKTTLPLAILLLLFCTFCKTFSQTYDFVKIGEQITAYNRDSEFDQTILLLERIISDKKATAYDRYQAYYFKYQTYKRLFVYDRADFNLNLALEEGLKSDKKELIAAQVKFEKLFMTFDLLKFEEVNQLLLTINEQDLNYVSFRTQAYYYAVLGIMEVKRDQLKQAEAYYKKSILLLEKHDPQNLPMIYRKQIDLYRRLNQYDKSLESFEKGLYYAKKYNIDVYALNMYFDLTNFYKLTNNIEKAVQTQEISDRLAKEYNEGGVLGELNVLENELEQEKINAEKKKDRIIIMFLIASLLVMVLLFLLLYKYLSQVRKNKKLLEKENEYLRSDILQMILETEKNSIDAVRLTDRQNEIIELVKQGKTNKEIGNALFVSENTVKYHLKNIYEVLRVNSRVEL